MSSAMESSEPTLHGTSECAVWTETCAFALACLRFVLLGPRTPHTISRTGRTRRPHSVEVRGRKIEKFFHGVLQQAPIVPMVRSDRHFIFTVLGPKKDLGHFRMRDCPKGWQSTSASKAKQASAKAQASVQTAHSEVPGLDRFGAVSRNVKCN